MGTEGRKGLDSNLKRQRPHSASKTPFKMPYGKPMNIKNAGRVMEQFVQIVVPRGSQQASSGFMGVNAGRGGVDGHQSSSYQNSSNNSSTNGSTSGGNNWKQHAWAQN